ncbi:hypothetical protein CI109_101115 [Kwoniella shandongensis]|uniref:Dynactin subunit 4 n=1 Tax=Kwoniella shandongensis TaxID=1734106 RepID=A0A5M6CAR2_9TREE|nr:uncharacterized protein CI109_001585 [Kwoniella shandongensis]KAA5530179.1 hypothetical protein CI109_001585 [Kwoniella shandongensis]
MSLLYACSHLDPPISPLPPSYPSSSSSFSPLHNLYFCEECDAVRCDQCVAVEVASYFCPNCLFDVPSANVRADKNRCARSCFSCPQCSSSLSIQATDSIQSGEASSSTTSAPGPPYILTCSGCRWSSKEVGWEFEKPTGIALQLQKTHSHNEPIQSEFDALKEHLDSYISTNAPPIPTPRSTRAPFRHISHLTQMASKALHRDLSGMAGSSARARPRGSGVGKDGEKEKVGWDVLGEYESKTSWKQLGLESGLEDVEKMKKLEYSGVAGVATLDRTWDKSWNGNRMASAILPQRIPLQTKLTKRCPHPTCRHLLIQPDTKSVRMKIKMVAMNYLPHAELGRRKRRVTSGSSAGGGSSENLISPEEAEMRRRERRLRGKGPLTKEEDESMDRPLEAGQVYTFALALTNPLYDPIQIRLTQPHGPKNAPEPNHLLYLPTQHFTINALKDAWAYDEEEAEEDPTFGAGGSEAGFSEEGTVTTGTGTGTGTLSKKSRMSILVGGSTREKRSRGETGVEKKGNTSIVGLEVEILPEAKGKVEFDLEVRYTYRADEVSEKGEKGKEEYKTFTFWIRVNAGQVE